MKEITKQFIRKVGIFIVWVTIVLGIYFIISIVG